MRLVGRVVRATLASLGAAVVLGGVIQLVAWRSRLGMREKLAPLYAVTSALRKGMPRAEVVRLIEAQPAGKLHRVDLESGDITIWVNYSATDFCSTSLSFSYAGLQSSSTVGEDGPRDFCPGAPADVR